MSYLLDSAIQRRLNCGFNYYKTATVSSMAVNGIIYYGSLDTNNSHNSFSATLGSSSPDPTITLDNGYTYRLQASICYYKNGDDTNSGYTEYQWHNGATAIGSKGLITDGITVNIGSSGPTGMTVEENAICTINLSGAGTTGLTLKILSTLNNVNGPEAPSYGTGAWYVKSRMLVWQI
tara:strand:+ start:1556 stop:2089 length:534 start_codon:yes stop_codon:yes gene_type:complete